jgi:Fe-S-cluster containining protein
MSAISPSSNLLGHQACNGAACCRDMDIDPMHLLFPERMSPDGQAFLAAHGLDTFSLAALRDGAEDRGNGLVRITHRCQHLTADLRCDIYATRPAICRAFDCTTRVDCARLEFPCRP